MIGSSGFALKWDICSLTQSSSSKYTYYHVRSLFIGWKKIRATLLRRLIPCGLVTVPPKTNILKPQRKLLICSPCFSFFLARGCIFAGWCFQSLVDFFGVIRSLSRLWNIGRENHQTLQVPKMKVLTTHLYKLYVRLM